MILQCKECGKLKEHQAKGFCQNCYIKYFYRTHPEYRAKAAKYQRERHQKNREKINKERKEKYQTDPEYRKKRIEYGKKADKKRKLKKQLEFVKIPGPGGYTEYVYANGVTQEIQSKVPKLMDEVAKKLLKDKHA